MKIKFVYSHVFRKNARRLHKRYPSLYSDLLTLENELIRNPDLGVNLGSGIRKIRIAIASKGKGKRGGAQVITYQEVIFSIAEHTMVMVTIYDKSELESISVNDIKSIVKKTI